MGSTPPNPTSLNYLLNLNCMSLLIFIHHVENETVIEYGVILIYIVSQFPITIDHFEFISFLKDSDASFSSNISVEAVI